MVLFGYKNKIYQLILKLEVFNAKKESKVSVTFFLGDAKNL